MSRMSELVEDRGMESPREQGSSPVADVFRMMAPRGSQTEPFKVAFAQNRITGQFDISQQEDADEMIKMINAVKPFLKKVCGMSGWSPEGLDERILQLWRRGLDTWEISKKVGRSESVVYNRLFHVRNGK